MTTQTNAESIETSGIVTRSFYLINRPIEFSGSAEERAENYASHRFSWDEESRCVNCDSRPSHVAAHYPCPVDPPRETVLCVSVGSTVSVTGEGTVDFLHRDDSVSGVLTPPSNGAPAFITGVEGLSFRLNGDLTVEEA